MSDPVTADPHPRPSADAPVRYVSRFNNAPQLSGDEQHASFCSLEMGQWWQDLQVWEWLLNDHPEIREVIELGTSTGGFAAYLSVQCRARQMAFSTYDNGVACAQFIEHNGFLKFLLEPHLVIGDLWGSAGEEVIAHLQDASRPPLLLFCDDGDKRREYKLFAPHLQPRDILAVHDWSLDPNGEFGPQDHDPALTQMIYVDVCERNDSHTRFFQKA